MSISLKARVVLLSLLLVLAAQVVIALLSVPELEREATASLRIQLDLAERLMTTRVAQMREQGRFAASAAGRDGMLARALASRASDAALDVLVSRAQRSGAVQVMLVRSDGSMRMGAQVTNRRPLSDPKPSWQTAFRHAHESGGGTGFVGMGSEQYLWALMPIGVGGLNESVVMIYPVNARLSEELSRSSLQVKVGTVDRLGSAKSATEGGSVLVRRVFLSVGDETVAAQISAESPDTWELIQPVLPGWLLAGGLGLAAAVCLPLLLMNFWFSPLRRLSRTLVEGLTKAGVRGSNLRAADDLRGLEDLVVRVLKNAREREKAMQRAAFVDVGTGLPNRMMFRQRLLELLAPTRPADKPLAVLVVRIDRIRNIRGVLGPAVANAVIRNVAERLNGILRAFDAAQGGAARQDAPADPQRTSLLVRASQESFLLALPDCDSAQAEKIALRLSEAAGRPIEQEGQMLTLAAVVGFACWPAHGRDPDALIDAAEVMEQQAGQRQLRVLGYETEAERSRNEGVRKLKELRQAMEVDQLYLRFQPIITLQGEGVPLAEALLRWDHPERGTQNPAEFVPFAEETGLITALTSWVLDHALAQCARWKSAGADIAVAINISTRDVASDEFAIRVVERLRHHGISPSRLFIEIPEDALAKEPEKARTCLQILARLGVGLIIDDFGTTFGSLNRLRDLPIQSVKLAPDFVEQLTFDHSTEVIVRSTIDLAHSLSIKVAAERIEQQETLEALARLGCDLAQGYLIAKPMTAEDCARWMQEHRRLQVADAAAADAAAADAAAASAATAGAATAGAAAIQVEGTGASSGESRFPMLESQPPMAGSQSHGDGSSSIDDEDRWVDSSDEAWLEDLVSADEQEPNVRAAAAVRPADPPRPPQLKFPPQPQEPQAEIQEIMIGSI